jgi:hypothetical protein
LNAVTALGRFPGEISEAALFRALDDDSFFVAHVASQALARLNPDRDPEPVSGRCAGESRATAILS